MTPACSAGREVGIWKGFCLDAGPPSLPAAGRAAGPCPFPPEQRVQGPSLGGGAAGPPAHPPAAGHFQNRERGQGCSHQGPCLEGFLSPQAATACAGSGQAQPPPAAQPPPVAVAVPAAAEATLPARLRAEQIPLLEPLLWPAAAPAGGSAGSGAAWAPGSWPQGCPAVTGRRASRPAALSYFPSWQHLTPYLFVFLVSRGRPFPAGGRSPAPCWPSAPRVAPPVAASAEPSAGDPGPCGDQGAG